MSIEFVERIIIDSTKISYEQSLLIKAYDPDGDPDALLVGSPVEARVLLAIFELLSVQLLQMELYRFDGLMIGIVLLVLLEVHAQGDDHRADYYVSYAVPKVKNIYRSD